MIKSLSPIGTASILLLCALTWAVSHSYAGIFHDATLYALQAMARSNPASLGQDVFLRLGSQDRFTIFSPIYAVAMQAWGVETSAAVLTLSLQLALALSAWVLARTVQSSSLALLAIAAFIAIPGDYGADRIFACIEPFCTPRMAAEAFALGSIAALLSGRVLLSGLLTAVAMLFHPIMGVASLGAIVVSYFGLKHKFLGVLAVVAGLACLLVMANFAPLGQWGRFDATWLSLVQARSPYLFLSGWSSDSWSRAADSITTLLLAAWILPTGRARSLARITLVVVAGGFALTFVACDLLHLVLFTQLQPWRAQWLSSAVAALLLPMTVTSLWAAGPSRRATAIMLASAWIFSAGEFVLIASGAALLNQLVASRVSANEAKLLFLGACCMAFIAVVWRVATNLQFTDSHYVDLHASLWLKRTIGFCRDGAAPMAIICGAWWLMRSMRRVAGPLIICLVLLAAAAIGPTLFAQWTYREFPAALILEYEPWRQRIPPSAEVLWPESPLFAWIVLQRPSFLSTAQSSGMVFSRATALELQRRADQLKNFIPPESSLDWSSTGPLPERSVEQLQGICDLGAFDFLVTNVVLNRDPVASPIGKSSHDRKSLKLYECRS
jgi:hypothetical protein